MRIAITGATGQLGGRVARRLADDGVELRLVVRDPTRAPQLPGAEVAQAEFRDTAAVQRALTGVEVVLMVSAAESVDRRAEHFSFVDGAVAAGVRQLVYTSFYGAGPDCAFTLGRDHFATEEHIRASGVAFTFLRDNFYADFMTLMAGPDRVIRGPAADGRVSIVARDDIAEVAAAVLRRANDHAGATHNLTGPQSLSLDEVAATLSAELGQPFRYQPETVAEAYESRAGYGAPGWQVDAWVSTYTAIATGEVCDISDDIQQITGRPATSLAELLRR
ncbi:uncharacterized protein YbjT [Jatrophihabitans sp. GAS493]|uniref:SDR family oxidoreductase n=1 Tax=Jatrophihabitans sp. GAS493 TaxID=1907575 RepID=UPI000BB715E7|nr:SDR family oxidoreductase [Jatrophihabitans sp. GAS493]SOD71446.1 uncharacterized protein YbjT [Jatrophihabitans sp. GAS493]